MSKPTVKQLDESLKGLIEWERFALYLPGMTEVNTAVIKKDKKDDVIGQKLFLYETWLKVYPSASWQDVVQALEIAEENALANAIKSKSLQQPQFEPEKQVTGEIEVPEYVVNKLDKLHTLFLELTSNIKSETESAVENGTITIKKLIQHTQEQRAYKIEQLEKVQTTDDFFNAIHPHYTFLDCSLMIGLPSLTSKSVFLKAEAYVSDIKLFKKETKVKDLRCALRPYFRYKNPPKDTQVTIALENTWESEKIWMVEELIKTLFGLKPPDECQWFRVIPGSVIVTFLIDKHVTKQFSTKIQKHVTFMRLLGVISLEIGGVFVPLSERKGCFSFNDSLIQATLLGNREAVSFLIEHLKVNVDLQTQHPFVPLEEDEHRIKTYNTMQKLTKLKAKFALVLKYLKHMLSTAEENGNLSVQELVKPSVYLLEDEPIFAVEGLQSATTTDELFRVVDPYYNFLNYRMIRNLGNQLQETAHVFNDYQKKLSDLKRSNQFQSLQVALEQHFPTFNSVTNIKIKIGLGKMWQKSTIEHLEKLLGFIFTLCCCDEFLWFRVSSEPLTAVFLAPKHRLPLLMKSVKETQYFRLIGVILLVIGEVSVFEEKDDTLTFDKAIDQAEGIIDKINRDDASESDTYHKISRLSFFLSRMKFYEPTCKREYIEIDNNNNYILNYDSGSTPLIIACCTDQSSLVEFLLNNGANPNVKTEEKWTALMYASVLGNINVVCELLRHKAAVDVANSKSKTPLMLACSAGNTDVVKILLLKTTVLNGEGRGGSRPLHIATKQNNLQVVEVLLHSVSEEPVNITSLRRIPCDLYRKPCYYHVSLYQWGLNSLNSLGCSPLHIASKKGNIKIVEKLLEAKADTKPLDPYGKRIPSPLHVASEKGHYQIVQKLLDAKAKVNAWDHNDHTPLQVATYYNQSTVVEVLLKANACPNIGEPDNEKMEIPFHYYEGWSSIRVLSDDAIMWGRLSLLHFACSKGYLDIVDALLKAQADPNDQQNYSGVTPLHVVCTAVGLFKRTSLKIASYSEHTFLKVIDKLLEANADPNIQTSSKDTPLQMACLGRLFKIAERLIKGKADPNIANASEETPLMIASQKDCSEIAKLLLDAKAEINVQCYNGLTALHKASISGSYETLQLLLQYKADPNIRADDGSTPLYIATLKNFIGMVKVLLEAKANPNFARVEKYHQAVSDFMLQYCDEDKNILHLNATEQLLKTINYPTFQADSAGYTPLHVACMHGDPELVQLLLSYQADTTVKSPLGHTALIIAELLGHREIVDIMSQTPALQQ